jgi:hypothetical protein
VESGEAVRWPVGEYAGESWPRCALGLESERGQEAERSCRLQRQAGRGAARTPLSAVTGLSPSTVQLSQKSSRPTQMIHIGALNPGPKTGLAQGPKVPCPPAQVSVVSLDTKLLWIRNLILLHGLESSYCFPRCMQQPFKY